MLKKICFKTVLLAGAITMGVSCTGCNSIGKNVKVRNTAQPSATQSSVLGKGEEDEDDDVVKYDESVKSIKLDFIDNAQGEFTRNIVLELEGEEAKATYTSVYLDAPLEVAVEAEMYNEICEAVKKYSENGWKSDSVEEFESVDYEVKDIGNCKIEIESDEYAFTGTSQDNNLASALHSNMIARLFPLEWENTGEAVFDKTLKRFYMSYKDFTGEESDARYFNYVTNPNEYVSTESTREFLGASDMDLYGRNIEAYFSNANGMGYTYFDCITKVPLEYEFINLVSKIDIETMKDADEEVKLTADDKYAEAVYELIYQFDNEEQVISCMKKDNTSVDKENFENVISWLYEVWGVDDWNK